MNLTPTQIAKQLRAFAPAAALLRQDHRLIQVGDVFVAFSGDTHDGRQYIGAAFAAGASAVLADELGFTSSNRRVLRVENLKQVLGLIAAAYYGHPSKQLHCLALTGTNGKTTVTHWVAQLLEHLQGKPSALLGTLGAGLLGHTQATGLTTPHASDVQRFISQAVSQGAANACIEATSIGLDEGRLNGVAFKVAALTNLSQDHLDYHGTMDAYAQSKRALFQWHSLSCVVINLDDAFGASLLDTLRQQRPELRLISTGFSTGAMLRATDLRTQGDATQHFTVHYQGLSYAALLPALGRFNVDNALTALGCCLAQGFELQHAIELLPTLRGVAGRMQVVGTDPLTVVDFAHTPDGLAKALQTLAPVASDLHGTLHVVFGCGGDRDASKRPLMGAIAHQYARKITITNDNPRSENPVQIARQIAQAATGAVIELDRAAAIAHAIANAHAQDVVLIAGKGHETTQMIAGQTLPFSDLHHASQALALRHGALR